MRAAVVLVLVGCYAPHAVPGSPCASDGSCPDGLQCVAATCVAPGTSDDAPVSTMPDAHLVDGCTPSGPELCGDGIDQDCDGIDPACAANDAPGDAIDISAGGTFMADLTYAHDDVSQTGCSGDGGRDVFYKVVLSAPEVVYFDTFGSSFGTVVRVIAGSACTATGAVPACTAGACGGAQSQLAQSLPAGTSCVIVDQHAGDTTGALVLHVKRAGRDATPLAAGVHTMTGNSCSGANVTQPGNGCVINDSKTAEDVAYYFTACPAQTLTLDASTCADSTKTHYDTVMYLRAAGTNQSIACDDDSNTCTARPDRADGHPDGSIISGSATGPNLFMLTVDGYDGACGVYQLDTNLQ
jgi:hypothetical protein